MGGLTRGRASTDWRVLPEECCVAATAERKPGSRVIQAQGEFDSNMLVKIVGSWVGKTKISQNL